MIGQKLTIPVFEAVFNDEDIDAGVKVISFVEIPAIESDGVALSKMTDPLKFAADERKFTFTAPVLIPDKKIFRMDASGNPYYLVFTAEKIERLRNKFMKEKLTDVTNVDHNEQTLNTNSYVIESFIIQSKAMVKAMTELGLEELPIGTWVVTYKVGDKETYNKMLANKLNGVSVEAFVGMELKQLTAQKPEIIMNKQDKNVKKQSKLNTLLADLKALLLEDEAPIQYVLEDGSILETDASGKITSPEGVKDGEYKLAPDQEFAVIVVKDGAVVEKKAAEAPKDDAPADEQPADASKLSGQIYGNYTLEDGTCVSVEVSQVNKASTWVEDKVQVLAPGTYKLIDGGELVVGDAGNVVSAPFLAPEGAASGETQAASKVKMSDAKTADGQVLQIDDETQVVSIVAEDGTLTPAPEGEYPLEDGSVLVVDKDSKVVEVIPPVAASRLKALSAAVNDLNAKLTDAQKKLSKTPAVPTPAAPKKEAPVDMSKMSVAERAAFAAKQRMSLQNK